MFEFLTNAFKRRPKFETEALQALLQATGVGLGRMQMMLMVAQRVVDSLEKSVRVSGQAKKALAMEMVRDDLVKLGIVAPDSLIDTAIEASVKLLKALGKEDLPFRSGTGPPRDPVPRGPAPELQEIPILSKVDVTGRPPNGNSEKGLSL